MVHRPDMPSTNDRMRVTHVATTERRAVPGDDERLAPRDVIGGAGRTVPQGIRTVGMWSLWTLLLGAVVYFAISIAVLLGSLVLTLLAGALLTSLMRPVVSWLDRHGWNRLLATWAAILLFLLLLGGLGWFLQMRISSQLSALGPTLTEGLDRLRTFLVETVGLSQRQVDAVVNSAIAQFSPSGGGGGGSGDAPGTADRNPGGTIVTGATTAVTALAGVVLALFTAFWLSYDGERMWRSSLLAIPRSRRAAVDDAGRAGWHALGGYLRGTTIIALGDAIGIGVALVLIGVPLPFALAVLTFLGAYIPVVGAFLAGLAAVVVAFSAGGLTDALLTLGAVIVVQQIEGNVLQPLVMRRAVSLHPLVIVYVLSIGGLLYGIAGAVIAVPLAAVGYAVAAAVADRGEGGAEDIGQPAGAEAEGPESDATGDPG